MRPFLLILGIFFLPLPTSATVEPKLEYMVERSELIIIGRVSSVENPGASSRTVDMLVIKNLRGVAGKTLRLRYQRYGKGDISFEQYRKDKTPIVLYLKRGSGDSYKLIDEWFGAQPANPVLLLQLNSILTRDSKGVP